MSIRNDPFIFVAYDCLCPACKDSSFNLVVVCLFQEMGSRRNLKLHSEQLLQMNYPYVNFILCKTLDKLRGHFSMVH